MEYLYKRLVESDVDGFKKLLLIVLEVFEDAPYNADDAFLKTLLEKPEYYAIAAFDKDMVIGGVTGYELKLPNKKSEVYVYDLAVDKKYRKRGVATALVAELKLEAKKNGVSMLFVEAESKDLDAVYFLQSLKAEQIEVAHFNINL